MKYIYIILIAIAIITSVFLVKNKKQIMEEDNESSYKTKIELIERKVIDLTSPNDLLLVKEFNELSNVAEQYLDSALFFIKDTDQSVQKKMIVIFSLKKVSFENYLIFFKNCVDIFKKGDIEEFLLALVLNPGYNWNYKIIKNYNNKYVVKILNELKSEKSLSKEMKYIIDFTLKGYLWMEVEERIEMNK
jgi:hypothetical protein